MHLSHNSSYDLNYMQYHVSSSQFDINIPILHKVDSVIVHLSEMKHPLSGSSSADLTRPHLIRAVALALIVTLLPGAFSQAHIDWCNIGERFCQNQGAHIGCETTKFPFGECENIKVIHFDDDLKIVMTERHNEYRSKIALGEVPRFPKASKMQEMVWDNNLAYLALKHVKHCKFKHDECRATEDFPYSGQNIALRSTLEKNNSYPGVLEAMMDRWFREHASSDPLVIEEFTENDLHLSGHLNLAFLREANTHVGCGYITFESDDDDGHW